MQNYGTTANAIEVRAFVEHVIEQNLQSDFKSPVCIWGLHGIGKTDLVKEIAEENGYDFAYIAPAQFEEMGDLLGMPAVEGDKTIFKQPKWVPTSDNTGILLIDDVNRADDRILRGIMQLLQNYELVSWKLPPKWQIILTANPDDSDYSVTTMDDAMLTRMMHITMKFEVKAWINWAEKNKIDERGINFILTYPEIVKGKRTTPRSLVQFFKSIAKIEDLRAELPLVQMLASSCLDTETVATFLTFVQQNLSKLLSPADILNAKDFEALTTRLIEQVQKDILRVDILSAIISRLNHHLEQLDTPLSAAQIKNVQSFILLDFIPNDLRLSFLQGLMSSKNASVKMVLSNPEISRLLLSGM